MHGGQGGGGPMCGPHGHRILAGQHHDVPCAGGPVPGQDPQCVVADAGPVDAAVAVLVQPQVLEAGIPDAAFESVGGQDASDDGVDEGPGDLFGGDARVVDVEQGALVEHLDPLLPFGAAEEPPAPAGFFVDTGHRVHAGGSRGEGAQPGARVLERADGCLHGRQQQRRHPTPPDRRRILIR